MECQNTIKNLKINKNKSIGEIVIIVEGERDEFTLLKHIFVNILEYNYISFRRNKVIKHEFVSKENNNTVIIANTQSSSIESIFSNDSYTDEIYNLLRTEYHRSLKNTRIYFLWDRDRDSSRRQDILENALKTLYNPLENEYDLNGMLLLSYPCLESYSLSNFEKRFEKNTFNTSQDAKKKFKSSSIYKINKINEKTLLLAVENMHRSMLNYNIKEYDTDNFKCTNEKIFKKEEQCYEDNGYYNALSLISIMLIDLGIIEKISDLY